MILMGTMKALVLRLLIVALLPSAAGAETYYFKGTTRPRFYARESQGGGWFVAELTTHQDIVSQRIVRGANRNQDTLLRTQIEVKRGPEGSWTLTSDSIPQPKRARVRFKNDRFESVISSFAQTNERRSIITIELKREKKFATSNTVMDDHGKEIFTDLLLGESISKAEFDSAIAGKTLVLPNDEVIKKMLKDGAF